MVLNSCTSTEGAKDLTTKVDALPIMSFPFSPKRWWKRAMPMALDARHSENLHWFAKSQFVQYEKVFEDSR